MTAITGRHATVTSRNVLAVALPMALAYLTTPLLGLVGTAVVGHLGQAALLGGLAAGALVFDVAFGTLNALRSGTTGLIAQAYGRGDLREETAVFCRAALLSLLCGALLLLALPLILAAAVWLISPDSAVSAAMRSYVQIRGLSAPLALFNYVVLGYVLGRGEGALGLSLQIVLNGVNIVLAILLGVTLGFGLEGIAWASVGGEAAAAIAGAIIIGSRLRKRARVRRSEILDTKQLRRMLMLNGDIMIRSFVLLAAFVMFTRQGAQFGTVTLAANAVLLHLFYIAGYFIDGIATAVEQLVGRTLGAGDERGCRRAITLSLRWGLALALVAAMVFMIAGESLLQLLTTAEDVLEHAYLYLPWAALTALCGVLAFLMDGIFIGATWSRDMRNMMLLSLAVYAGAIAVLGPLLGNLGLWLSFNLFLLCRGASLALILPKRLRAAFPAQS